MIALLELNLRFTGLEQASLSPGGASWKIENWRVL
jgi:hypothetical protein